MATNLMLRIITPDRVVFEEEVQQVVATAIDGELAILPNHEPILTALDIDMVRFKVSADQERSAAVMGGVMEVNNNEVVILSDLAELDHEIDEAAAHQEKEKIEAEKIQKVDKLDVHIMELGIARSLARLRVAEHARLRRRGQR
jgi:F-type H+-transporting ATPase subunit epsilon